MCMGGALTRRGPGGGDAAHMGVVVMGFAGSVARVVRSLCRLVEVDGGDLRDMLDLIPTPISIPLTLWQYSITAPSSQALDFALSIDLQSCQL